MLLQSIVLIVHIGVAFLIIGLVLLQRGKGADAGAGFGSGASGTVFGARGSASFLSRATGALATVFFATSLTLAYLAGQQQAPTSLMEQGMEMPAPGVELTPPAFGETELPQLPTIGVEPEMPQLPTIGVEPEVPAEGGAPE